MPQVLKESQRIKIIDAAREEFFKNGIRNTSLRTIAADADMTVGNIYHYFKDKNAIVDTVISPALDAFKQFSKLLDKDSEHIIVDMDNVSWSEEKVRSTMIMLADCLVNTEEHYNKEMYILVNDDEIIERHSKNFFELIKQIYGHAKPDFIITDFQFETMSLMASKAIFCGLREGIKCKCNSDSTSEEFRVIMRHYLLQCFSMIKF